jgi:hypothetical protein
MLLNVESNGDFVIDNKHLRFMILLKESFSDSDLIYIEEESVAINKKSHGRIKLGKDVKNIKLASKIISANLPEYTTIRYDLKPNSPFYNSLPKIPKEFKEKFISELNKKNFITTVLVEYNQPVCTCDTLEKLIECCYSFGDDCKKPYNNGDFYGLFPKVDKTDTINIVIKK